MSYSPTGDLGYEKNQFDINGKPLTLLSDLVVGGGSESLRGWFRVKERPEVFLLYQSLIPSKAQQPQVDGKASCRPSISCRPLPVLCRVLGPP